MAEASVDIIGMAEAMGLLQRLQGGFADLTELHEWWVIAAQAYTLDHWPSSPGLSPLTLASRASGGSTPLQDSGRLWRSITGGGGAGISRELGTLNEANAQWGRLGSSLIQAHILDQGGTITPKSRRYLAMPATPEATRSGGPRTFTGDLAFVPMKSRDGGMLVDGQKVTITRGKHKGQQRIRAREIAPGRYHTQFFLVRSVTIAGWHFMPEPGQLIPDLQDATMRYITYKATGKAA